MGSFYIFVLFGAVSIASGTSVLQYYLGHADCSGVPYGWLVRNPLDCGSYFICEDEIQYERCPSILHFDAEKRVCNWPDKAKCDWTALPPVIIPGDEDTDDIYSTLFPIPTRPVPTTTLKPTTIKPTTTTTKRIETTTKPTTTLRTTTRKTTAATTTTTRKPQPNTTRMPQPSTTRKSPPTTTRTPQTSSTVNHEDILNMKWICENVILKDTIVGEVESESGAYDPELGKRVDPITTYNPTKVSCMYDGVYFLPHPTACDNYYICSHRSLIAHSCGNGVSWNFKTNQCEISLKAKCYRKETVENSRTTKLAAQSTGTTPSTTERVTRYVTPEKPKTTLNEKVPICPMNVQTYYPHSEDCRKYYICIAGLPVLTTCPDELYWDDVHKFCGLPQYTECKAKMV